MDRDEMTPADEVAWQRRAEYQRGVEHGRQSALREVAREREALRRIASMPMQPRPDGTHNYCRAALIGIARAAVEREEAQHGS